MSYPDIADLQRVNSEVNALPYVSDPLRYDSPDFWARIGPEGGDCEDYALGKLHRLLKLGWPIYKLRLACCHVETGEYHAVLAVDLLGGGHVVLDNRQEQVQTLEALRRVGYTAGTELDKIQRTGGSRTWMRWVWQEEQ